MKTSEVLLRPRSVARAATLMLSLFMVLCIATSSVAYAADSDDATNDEPSNKERLAELKEGESANDWLHRADEALYRAKDAGRNSTSLSD